MNKFPAKLIRLISEHGILDLRLNTVSVYISSKHSLYKEIDDYISNLSKFTTREDLESANYKEDVGALLGVWAQSVDLECLENDMLKVICMFDRISDAGELPKYAEFSHPELYREHNDGN